MSRNSSAVQRDSSVEINSRSFPLASRCVSETMLPTHDPRSCFRGDDCVQSVIFQTLADQHGARILYVVFMIRVNMPVLFSRRACDFSAIVEV